jgi:hypothetical protein
LYLIFEKGVLVDEYTKWLTEEEIQTINRKSEDDNAFENLFN